tara:strand:- start:608 stop:790 length:183 start_codon:yes stop_codon:yes gene_type:complete
MKHITLEDAEAQTIVNALYLLANHLEDRVELNDLDSGERASVLEDISRANDLANALKVVL